MANIKYLAEKLFGTKDNSIEKDTKYYAVVISSVNPFIDKHVTDILSMESVYNLRQAKEEILRLAEEDQKYCILMKITNTFPQTASYLVVNWVSKEDFVNAILKAKIREPLP